MIKIGLRATLALLAGVLVARGTAVAADSGCHVAETSVRVGGGVNPSSLIQYYALHVDVGFPLWERADRWFSARDITARWIIEPWVAYVDDDHGPHQTSSFELGVSPLFGKLTFLGDARLRPFIDGGEGIVYTDLRKQRYGTRVQFTSQFGVGLEYQVRPDLAVSIAARFRHMSNAGLASSNPGINTVYGLIGLTFR